MKGLFVLAGVGILGALGAWQGLRRPPGAEQPPGPALHEDAPRQAARAFVEPTNNDHVRPAARALLEDAADRAARARTPKEAMRALGLEPGARLDEDTRRWIEKRLLEQRESSVARVTRVRRRLGDESPRIQELKRQYRLRSAEVDLRTYRAGDYCVVSRSRQLQPLRDRFVCPAHGRGPGEWSLVLVRRPDPELLRLRRAITIEKFNAMKGSQRRRVLRLRAEDLADPEADKKWLSAYFPETFEVDPRTATIR